MFSTLIGRFVSENSEPSCFRCHFHTKTKQLGSAELSINGWRDGMGRE